MDVTTRQTVRKANAAYRRASRRGGYAALRTQRINERQMYAALAAERG